MYRYISGFRIRNTPTLTHRPLTGDFMARKTLRETGRHVHEDVILITNFITNGSITFAAIDRSIVDSHLIIQGWTNHRCSIMKFTMRSCAYVIIYNVEVQRSRNRISRNEISLNLGFVASTVSLLKSNEQDNFVPRAS